ncbi:RNA recognition [Musa troglodytarum]|uniref:RNA recognition n=1 Tax=Musa troglodytarum TaxID=320322 RepID=A0A9E7I9W4_9LILI|nr:RNA recognition [Musa troglodytarum]URE48825.1 RNA recognition [Musa troglodytarum]
MTTMSDDGDRTCPLCAEEMDLTDQQLKPCKCGYEICVWCWHQINDMAEKEETEGRCPACRTPYDKERIVRMAANCKRLVAEINAEKKQKSQKSKLKTSLEAKKHLSGVRVVQRNLVYIIGLPANLCDRSILERKEYFGQYGKIIKVSISRSASAPSHQASSNSTFSVYVMYAREEEAIRCIQAVHNYILEGKTLKACFGTTKYCHAWLRNMTCSNPDCLYLHDIGSQDDSFTKDEVISAYTRSRVPQIASNSSQRRSGIVLPPPADDFSNSITASARNCIKSPSNIASTQIKGSPPSSSAGKPTVLPAGASWGLQSSNCRPPTASAACSQVPYAKQKVEMVGNLCLPPTLTESTNHPSVWNEVVPISKVPEGQTLTITKLPSLLMESTKQCSSWHDDVDMASKVTESRDSPQISDVSQSDEPLSPSPRVVTSSDCSSRFSSWDNGINMMSKVGEENQMAHSDDGFRQLEYLTPVIEKQCQASVSDVSTVDVSGVTRMSQLSSNFVHCLPVSAPEDKETCIHVNGDNTKPTNSTSSKGFDRQFGRSDFDRATQGSSTINEATHSLCSSFSSVKLDSRERLGRLNVNQNLISDSDSLIPVMPLCNISDPAPWSKASQLLDKHGGNESKDQSTEPLKEKLISAVNSKDRVILPCDDKIFLGNVDRLSSSPYSNHSHNSGNCSSSTSSNTDAQNKQTPRADRMMDRKLEMCSFPLGEYALSNGRDDQSSSPREIFRCPEMNCNAEKVKSSGGVDDIAYNNKYATVNLKGESSIISDILSLDVDPWDDSSNTVNNFASLLGETEKQERSFKLLSSWKSNNSNQSRFSFARQESQGNIVQPITSEVYAQKFCSSSHDSYESGLQNGILFNTFEAPNTSVMSNPVISPDKAASTSRSKISAPPGFSAPNRVPPPGFSSQDRFYETHEAALSENHLVGSPAGNHYQSHIAGNPGDVELIDPAILAVGKGRMSLGIDNLGLGLKSTFPVQSNPSDNDLRLHLLKQQSLSSYQNLGIPDCVGDRFLPLRDAYITSQLSAENHCSLSPMVQMSLQQLRNSQLLNKQWDGFNDLWTESDMGMSEVMRNERVGLSNFYSSNEDKKLHLPKW